MANESIPLDRRVFYCLMFLGCMRFGEAAFLRWKHYRPDLQPLGCLHIVGTYNSKLKREKETKAQRPRRVPVAPLLARLLAEWKLSGWAAAHGRPPGPEDLLMPSRLGSTESRKVMNSLKRLKLDLKRLGLRERRQHDARRTRLSTVLAAGANNRKASPSGSASSTRRPQGCDLPRGGTMSAAEAEGRQVTVPVVAS